VDIAVNGEPNAAAVRWSATLMGRSIAASGGSRMRKREAVEPYKGEAFFALSTARNR
jgi:hypothetical protein